MRIWQTKPNWGTLQNTEPTKWQGHEEKKEILRNYHRLEETKDTSQLNVVWCIGLAPEWEGEKKYISGNTCGDANKACNLVNNIDCTNASFLVYRNVPQLCKMLTLGEA